MGVLGEIIATGGVAITLLYSFRFIALVVNSWVLKESCRVLIADWTREISSFILETHSVSRGGTVVRYFRTISNFHYDPVHYNFLLRRIIIEVFLLMGRGLLKTFF